MLSRIMIWGTRGDVTVLCDGAAGVVKFVSWQPIFGWVVIAQINSSGSVGWFNHRLHGYVLLTGAGA